MTIQQLETLSNSYPDTRQLIGEVIKFLAANPGGSGGGSIQSATITLNDEQIKALPTTAVEIVPVAGVDKTYAVLFGFLRWNTTVAYTNVNADNTLSIGYGSAATGDFIDHAASPTQLRTGTGIRTSLVGPAGGPHPTLNNPDIVFGFYNNFPELDFNNVSLVVYADNLGSGNLTGGNAANTLKVKKPRRNGVRLHKRLIV